MHLIGSSRVHNVTVTINCAILVAWYNPVPTDMSFELPLDYEPGTYTVYVTVDNEIQIERMYVDRNRDEENI